MKTIWRTRVIQALLLCTWIVGDIMLLPQVLLEIGARECCISAATLIIWCICCFFLGVWTEDKKICRIKVTVFAAVCIILLITELLLYYVGATDTAMIIVFLVNCPIPIWTYCLWDCFDLSLPQGIEILCCGLPYILIWLSTMLGTRFAKETVVGD